MQERAASKSKFSPSPSSKIETEVQQSAGPAQKQKRPVSSQPLARKKIMAETNVKNEEYHDFSSIPSGFRFVRGAYWFLVVCGVLIFVAMLAGLESADKMSVGETSFMMIINILILYGLSKRKSWVV